MIDLGDKNNCICPKVKNAKTPQECEGKDEYTISEKGKSVTLQPKNNQEKACAIVLDGCVISKNDKKLKCDAIFLWKSNNKKVSFLVELKGAGDIKHAFEQLAYTKKRKEYENIIKLFKETEKTKVNEKFIIISNGSLAKPEKEKLENEHKIRIHSILHSEPTSPIPNLRNYISF